MTDAQIYAQAKTRSLINQVAFNGYVPDLGRAMKAAAHPSSHWAKTVRLR